MVIRSSKVKRTVTQPAPYKGRKSKPEMSTIETQSQNRNLSATKHHYLVG